MAILHIQIGAEGKTQDRRTVQIPPPIALREGGPCIQVTIGVAQSIAEQLLQQGTPIPQPVPGRALIDTGASRTCIDDTLAQQLGLPPIDVVTTSSASHASTQQNVYPVQIEVVGSNIKVNVNAIGAALAAQGIAVLIGRDFLQHCTLFYNGITGQITLSL